MIQSLISTRHLKLSGLHLGVTLRTDTKKTCFKEIGLRTQNTMHTLHSMANKMGEGGGLYDHLYKEHKGEHNHFDFEQNNHTSSGNHAESRDDCLHLKFLTTLNMIFSVRYTKDERIH